MAWIGVDPGATGGIAWIVRDRSDASAEKMPGTWRDIHDLLKSLAAVPDCMAIIEKVHAMPKQGVSSTFKFGVNFGALLMALTSVRIPFEEVSPARWTKALGVTAPPHAGTTVTKNLHKAKAQQLFPHLKITHATADSLLLAEYALRTFE